DQIEMPVAIVIDERAARAPLAGAAYSGARGHILESAFAAVAIRIVAIKDVAPPIGDVQIFIAVVVEVCYADAVSPARFGEARLARHILKFSAAGVAKEMIGRLLPLWKTRQPRAVYKKDILQPVVIEIEKRDSRS